MIEPIETGTINVPGNFSFVYNTPGLLNLLADARATGLAGDLVVFNFSKVEHVGFDAMSLLNCTIAHASWCKNTRIDSIIPSDLSLKQQLNDYGFLDHLPGGRTKLASRKGEYHAFSGKNVRPDVALSITELAKKNLCLDADKMEVIYNTLIELMSNTLRHANREMLAVEQWHLYIHCDKSKVCVSYIDRGIGIFESISLSDQWKQVRRKMDMVDNLQCVDDLLKGKTRSRFEMSGKVRGNGIQHITKDVSKDCFALFYVISNDVKIDLKQKQFTRLESKSRDTFIYFELHADNNQYNDHP